MLGTAIGWYANEQAMNSNLGVVLQSPSPTVTIREVNLAWSVLHEVSGSDTFAQVSSDTGSELISPTPYNADAAHPAKVYFPDGTHTIYVYSYCSYDRSTNCNFPGLSAVIRLEGMDTTVEDTNPPTATINGGSLASGGRVFGRATLQFTATDGESGVRESELLIDGSPVITHSYSNQCPYMNFAACPQSMGDSMTWDTSVIPNGEHRISLRITDASGNIETVDDHAMLIDNPSATRAEEVSPPPCTAAASTATSIRVVTPHHLIISNYRQRVNLRGKLIGPNGTPIVNATVEVLARPVVSGDNFSLISRLTTHNNGRFEIKLPPGTSRTVCLRYKPLSDGLYAAALLITQQVRAGLRLSVHPRHVMANGTITLRGGILGGFIPELGKVVELQVHYLGSWRVFRTLRTTPYGRFKSFYGFLGGQGVFAFRACVRAESNYPFVFGCSNEVFARAG
jgi:hypothetical protein